VYLVLWYRELAGKPLYSFDIRSAIDLKEECHG
jgi:hypothetical protein